MGYEVKLIIGLPGTELPEYVLDKEHPFDDGSGYPYLKNERGQPIMAGRRQCYFSVYATLDLRKLGYQDDALNRLINAAHVKAKDNPDYFYYYYADDGNTEVTEDRCGDKWWPVPLKEVLEAAKASLNPDDPYRRLLWAIALLTAMADTDEALQVLFFGH
jgi:hypothetical protein